MRSVHQITLGRNSYSLTALLLLMLFSIGGCRKKPPQQITADYLLDQHLTTAKDSVLISELLDTLLDHTAWLTKVRINKPFDPSSVNIYLFDGEAAFFKQDTQVGQLSGNCYYAGHGIVFLDDSFFQSFLNSHDLDRSPESKKSMMYWIIGHELGHFICGHLSGHFSPRSLDKFVSNSTIANREELQADSFYVHAIVQHRKLLASQEQAIMYYLNREIEHKVGKITTPGVGILFDYPNHKVVSYSKQPTHPEFVIRMSRMLELSSKMSRDSGLYNLVGSFIRTLKEN